MTNILEFSRRRILRRAAIIAGGGAVLSTGLAIPAAAATKMAQKAVGYQDTPMGKSRCDNCVQWQPPAACKLVDGAISPSGWCHIYAPKS
jgi:hypothetical protein